MKVGLTGNFASGKSTVSTFFEELGGVVVDTDTIAREIVLPGEEAYKEIITYFGDSILHNDSTINRKALASIVFNNREGLLKLNTITHPKILERTRELTHNSSKIFIVNVPLLFESHYDKEMDCVIIVTTSKKNIIERGKLRDNMSEEEVLNRLKNQISFNDFLKSADYIIDNSLSIENTRKQVVHIWKTITTNMR